MHETAQRSRTLVTRAPQEHTVCITGGAGWAWPRESSIVGHGDEGCAHQDPDVGPLLRRQRHAQHVVCRLQPPPPPHSRTTASRPLTTEFSRRRHDCIFRVHICLSPQTTRSNRTMQRRSQTSTTKVKTKLGMVCIRARDAAADLARGVEYAGAHVCLVQGTLVGVGGNRVALHGPQPDI